MMMNRLPFAKKLELLAYIQAHQVTLADCDAQQLADKLAANFGLPGLTAKFALTLCQEGASHINDYKPRATRKGDVYAIASRALAIAEQCQRDLAAIVHLRNDDSDTLNRIIRELEAVQDAITSSNRSTINGTGS